MSRQNLAWKDFRSSMKGKRSGGKRKSYYGFKMLLYFIDIKSVFKKAEKIQINQVFKKYTYVT